MIAAAAVADEAPATAMPAEPEDAAEAIRRARAESGRAVAEAGLTNDPLRYASGGIAAALGVHGVRRISDTAGTKPVDHARHRVGARGPRSAHARI